MTVVLPISIRPSPIGKAVLGTSSIGVDISELEVPLKFAGAEQVRDSAIGLGVDALDVALVVVENKANKVASSLEGVLSIKGGHADQAGGHGESHDTVILWLTEVLVGFFDVAFPEIHGLECAVGDDFAEEGKDGGNSETCETHVGYCIMGLEVKVLREIRK